ncbi:MAG TPA: winged helix-turn-helix domain-containing protein, partial [Polyangia bacterium]|nr:winged helix-turn-helix domain-containing protein [Polyangia bacterium]
MTFIEAALKVLEHEGRPLHSREIAERAVEWGLLSHVGKTPVQTMSGCLSAAVAKGEGKTPFARVTPGVFGLAAWDGHPPGRRAGGPPRPAAKKAAASVAVEQQVVGRTKEKEETVGEAEAAGETLAPD